MLINKLIKSIVKLIILLLILVFLVSGLISSLPKKDPYAIKVGSLEFSLVYFNKILEEAIQKLKIENDKNLSNQEVSYLKNNIVKDIIHRSLILLEAKSMGMIPSDNQVREEITKIPEFYVNGGFNRKFYEKTLKNYNINEKQLIEKIKEDIIISMFINSVSPKKQVLPYLSDIIIQDILQTREINLIKIPFNSLNIRQSINHEELKNIYKENQDQFMMPEQRIIEYITISRDFLLRNINISVSDEKLKQLYIKKGLSSTKTPEKREVKQILLNSLNNAKKARYALKNGENFELVANKYASKFKEINLGVILYKDLDKNISDQIFRLKRGEISEVIKTPLGFYIFKVVNIIPEQKKSFESVKKVLKEKYIEQALSKIYFAKIQNIKDKIDEGKNIKNLSKELELKTNVIKISLKQEKNIDRDPTFIKTAFSLPLGGESKVFSMKDRDELCILKVKAIIPEKMQDLEDVKPLLKKIWYNKQVKLEVDNIKSSINKVGDTSFYKRLSSSIKFQSNILTLSSNQFSEDIPLPLHKMIFEEGENSYTEPYIDYSKRIILIAEIKKISLLSQDQVEKYKSVYEPNVKYIEQQLILEDIIKNLQKKYKVIINPHI